jgi:hypothetical protein
MHGYTNFKRLKMFRLLLLQIPHVPNVTRDGTWIRFVYLKYYFLVWRGVEKEYLT